MKKILTVIGARPQIIKASALSRAIASKFQNKFEEHILHTGQHYDKSMSQVFFKELGIPEPHYQLDVGSLSHADQTAQMLRGVAEVLSGEKYNALLVYGDTNSTLAGALAASKLHVPVVHVEAGLRSYNKSMPEEINRVLCDHVSTLLFSPTITAVQNLEKEGFNVHQNPPYSIDTPKVFHCGDVMYDNSKYFAELAAARATIVGDLELDEYILVTIHRPYNTDDPERLNQVMLSLLDLSENQQIPLVFPVHPRTRKILRTRHEALFSRVQRSPLIHLIEPVGFLEMIQLEQHASLIITDSGGVQKEAYFFQKPCIVVRTETEWVELIQSGAAKLQFEMGEPFLKAAKDFLHSPPTSFPPIFGTGNAAEFIAEQIYTQL